MYRGFQSQGDLKNSPTLLKLLLSSGASEYIQDVMNEAEAGTHTPGSWAKEGMAHHLWHVVEHGLRAEGMPKESDSQALYEELTHLMTRAAMALWCYENSILEDNGPEGINANASSSQ